MTLGAGTLTASRFTFRQLVLTSGVLADLVGVHPTVGTFCAPSRRSTPTQSARASDHPALVERPGKLDLICGELTAPGDTVVPEHVQDGGLADGVLSGESDRRAAVDVRRNDLVDGCPGYESGTLRARVGWVLRGL